jgi:hypothetical protein
MKPGPKRKMSSCHPERKVSGLGLCRSCYRSKRYYEGKDQANPLLAKRSKLKTQYHLTPERLWEIFHFQGGLCPVCLLPLGSFDSIGKGSGNQESPQIDHDHKCCPGGRSCGKCVSGILHAKCNRGMGHFHDDPERLRRAAEYIERFNALHN